MQGRLIGAATISKGGRMAGFIVMHPPLNIRTCKDACSTGTV